MDSNYFVNNTTTSINNSADSRINLKSFLGHWDREILFSKEETKKNPVRLSFYRILCFKFFWILQDLIPEKTTSNLQYLRVFE
jgi:hypothetical protein